MAWERDEIWEALTEQAPLHMVVIDRRELRFTYTTRAARELLGYDLVGRTFDEAFPNSPARPIVERVFATGVAETVCDTLAFSLRSKGPPTPGRFFTRVFMPLKDRDGSVQAIAIHAQEVTAEVNARRALEASELRSRSEFQRIFALFDEAPVMLAVVEPPHWKLTLTNRGVRRLFDGRDLIGTNLVDMVPADNRTRKMLEHAYTTGRPTSFETIGQFPGIEGHAFLGSVVPIKTSDGTIGAILVAAVDVTEQRRAQQEIERAREDAVAAGRAKDQFLAMLGHELRNPLQPMLTGVQLMRMDGQTGPALDMLEREVHHVSRLVEDLLDISRISRGVTTLKLEAVDLRSIVHRGLELSSPLLEQTAHRVTTEFAPGPLGVWGDAHRLAQVVSNLVQNAAKYSAPGSAICITAERTNDRVGLRVADEGAGIAPEMLKRVFDAFVQGDQALDRSRGGLGIGLSIVKSLVHAHGGSVAVHSEGPGRGSTFTVELPSIELAPANRPTTEPRVPHRRDPSLSPIRVLVVDDNADATASLELGLAKLGYQVSIAYDGPSAIVLAKSEPPAIALLDLGLPVMDGYRLGEILRAEHQIPIVAISGYGQPADRERSKAAGFAFHFVKPVDMRELAALIDKLVASDR